MQINFNDNYINKKRLNKLSRTEKQLKDQKMKENKHETCNPFEYTA